MTSSLVGSEMCIRDRVGRLSLWVPSLVALVALGEFVGRYVWVAFSLYVVCLLYTSDAADDM
eukprot:3735706-Prorocentrum_lima.AAC.1